MMSFVRSWLMIAGAALLVMTGGNAWGQSAYCGMAFSDFAKGGDVVATISRDCVVGETISIPGPPVYGANDLAAAVFCDFSKSILVSPGGSTVCVLAAPRPIRGSRH